MSSRFYIQLIAYVLLLLLQTGCYVDGLVATVQDVSVRVLDAHSGKPVDSVKIFCESADTSEEEQFSTNQRVRFLY